MKAQPFHYRRGKVATSVPWFPADPALLNAWREDLFEIPEVYDYTLWLCGGVMEGWHTDDVDIIVTGDINNILSLERVMVGAMQLGFKHRQLIDIAWNDYYKKFLEKGPCERRAICCQHFFDHGYCTPESCAERVDDISTIIVGHEIVKNGFMLESVAEEATQMSEHLWRMRQQSPSDRQIQKIKAGVVYRYAPIIITEHTDFRDWVPWP